MYAYTYQGLLHSHHSELRWRTTILSSSKRASERGTDSCRLCTRWNILYKSDDPGGSTMKCIKDPDSDFNEELTNHHPPQRRVPNRL